MLHINYRPKDLSEVLGNNATVHSLASILARKPKQRPRVFLFEGPSGCGKTTLARIMAKKMGVVGIDLTEANSANFRGIDYVRDLISSSHLSPMYGKRRGWILDEIHMQTDIAQNAMLKVLEDTPDHVVFFLCTTNPGKLIPTILNRCSRHVVELLDDKRMNKLLNRVLKGEEKEIPEEVAESLIESSHGSPRHMLTLLDKIIDLFDDPEACAQLLKQMEEKEARVIDLCRALMEGGSWKKISKILTNLKAVEDGEGVRRTVLGYCSKVMMGNSKGTAQAYLVLSSFSEPLYDMGWPGLVMACYEASVGNKEG